MDQSFFEFKHAPSIALDLIKTLKVPDSVSIAPATTGYDLLLYDIIGCGCIEANDVVQALAIAGGAPVRVRINSPGGDAFEGFAIYNILAAYQGDISVVIDGVAASAAAYIAMAGDTVDMQPASFFMIHNGWTVTVGDRNRLATQISALSKIDEAQVSIFADRTGKDAQVIAAWLDAETWFSAPEAVDAGFADDIIDSNSVPAQPTLPSDPDAGEDDDGMPDMPMNFLFEKRRKLLAARLLTMSSRNPRNVAALLHDRRTLPFQQS